MRFVDSAIVSMVCPICGKEHSVEVSEHAFDEWQSGALIQNVMPTLSATEREQLITDICPSCQILMYGSDEEEDEGDDITACMQDSLAFTGQWW